MMSSPRITYTPRPHVTSGAELNALVAVYRIILDSCNENTIGVATANSDDVKSKKEKGGKHVEH